MPGIHLETSLSDISGITTGFLKRLERLGIRTIHDLLWHFPVRYEDFSEISKISDVIPGQLVTIRGTIESADIRQAWKRRMTIIEAVIKDDSGSIKATWFNQPYLLQTLKPGRIANFSGKVAVNSSEIYLRHPAHEFIGRAGKATTHTGRLVPIYPETRGLTSRGIRFLIHPILTNLEEIEEWVPEETLRVHSLPTVRAALWSIHFPQELSDADDARRRFTFENLFLLQLVNIRRKQKLAEKNASIIKLPISELRRMVDKLPFKLTFSQKRSLWEILKDMEKSKPMNRLLQGDVGSGKTVVAALAAFAAAGSGYQTAIMAPTEILASQHFATLQKTLYHIELVKKPTIGILTGSIARIVYGDDLATDVSKKAFAEKSRDGAIDIIIGTHALISGTGKKKIFKKLGLVVIDEQHRFGVNQRKALITRTFTDSTQTDTEKSSSDTKEALVYEEITYKIRGAVFEVKKRLGLGHKENIYQKALEKEFKKVGLAIEKEKAMPISYDNEKIGVYRPDFLIEHKIILEIKALPSVGKFEKAQIWHYLKGSSYRLALLVNFGRNDVEIKRIINGFQSPVESVSSPSSSVYVPHFLSMSATPIPRTFMLTIFGDLDVSLITELPVGRKRVETRIVPPHERDRAYEFIRVSVKTGRQVFVICPRIDKTQTLTDATRTNTDTAYPSDKRAGNFMENLLPRESVFSPRQSAAFDVKSVTEEYEKLSKHIFPEFKVAMLHGQLKAKEKQDIMEKFRLGNTQILVSTSVIEVGVDVPNATIMMIEGSERFGLAQIYQFRGRVGRGEHQSYCFLFTDSESASTRARLKAILEAKNGFELAELDLKIRGPGEFLGEAQSGFPDSAMSGLQDLKLVVETKREASAILEVDPKLEDHPLLLARLDMYRQNLHLE